MYEIWRCDENGTVQYSLPTAYTAKEADHTLNCFGSTTPNSFIRIDTPEGNSFVYKGTTFYMQLKTSTLRNSI